MVLEWFTVIVQVGGAVLVELWGGIGAAGRGRGVDGDGGAATGGTGGASIPSAAAGPGVAGHFADGTPPFGGLTEGRGYDDICAWRLSPAWEL